MKLAPKTKFFQFLRFTQNDYGYLSEDGWVIRREEGLTPNGNQLNGRWVLRDSKGKFVDFDQHRNDLIERHDITLVIGPPEGQKHPWEMTAEEFAADVPSYDWFRWFGWREGHHYCHESKEYAIKTGYPGILQKARKMGLIK
jgi:hypothetical protein